MVDKTQTPVVQSIGQTVEKEIPTNGTIPDLTMSEFQLAIVRALQTVAKAG